MAASTERAKTLAAKWATLADSGIHEKVNRQQRSMWEALHEFTKLHHARIVSLPYARNVRVEISPEKTHSFIVALQSYGYTPSCTEQVSVFNGKQFTQHDIIMVDLPSAAYLAGIAKR
jgi:hypothetical protein